MVWRLCTFVSLLALGLTLAAGASAHAAPTPTPSPSPAPTATPSPRPAISIFRVTMDNPGQGYGRGGWGGGWGGGLPYERVTGTIWLANDSLDTLQNVTLTIDFYNLQWYRSEGSKDYVIGSLGPKESQSLNYKWDNWQSARVVPRITVRYTQPGVEGRQTVKWDGYGP